MKYRLTFENVKGTRFSYLEDETSLQEGEWEAPFPNRLGDSTAHGLVEALLQSDRCPLDFFDHKIVSVKVRKV